MIISHFSCETAKLQRFCREEVWPRNSDRWMSEWVWLLSSRKLVREDSEGVTLFVLSFHQSHSDLLPGEHVRQRQEDLEARSSWWSMWLTLRQLSPVLGILEDFNIHLFWEIVDYLMKVWTFIVFFLSLMNSLFHSRFSAIWSELRLCSLQDQLQELEKFQETKHCGMQLTFSNDAS